MYEGQTQNAASQPMVDRQPEVSSEMERLTTQCKMIDEQLAQLEQKLNTVLAQRADKGAEVTSAPEPVRVPLAQAIHDRVHHLSLLSDQLTSIINRVEV